MNATLAPRLGGDLRECRVYYSLVTVSDAEWLRPLPIATPIGTDPHLLHGPLQKEGCPSGSVVAPTQPRTKLGLISAQDPTASTDRLQSDGRQTSKLMLFDLRSGVKESPEMTVQRGRTGSR